MTGSAIEQKEKLREISEKLWSERDDYFLELSGELKRHEDGLFGVLLKLVSKNQPLQKWAKFPVDEFGMAPSKWRKFESIWGDEYRAFISTLFSILEEVFFVARVRVLIESSEISKADVRKKIIEFNRFLTNYQNEQIKFPGKDKDIELLQDAMKAYLEKNANQKNHLENEAYEGFDLEIMFPLPFSSKSRKQKDLSLIYKHLSLNISEYLSHLGLDSSKWTSIVFEALLDIEKDPSTHANYLKR